MSNEKMTSLLKKQEEERKDLAAGVYEAWKPVKANEERLLSPYGGNYDNAPDQIKQEINKEREEFNAEWGTEGRLAIVMSEQQRLAREKLAKEIARIETILNQNNKDKDRGR